MVELNLIALQSSHHDPPFSLVESSIGQDGRFGWFLAMWHPEKSLQLEELGAELKLSIRNSDAGTISRMEVEKWLQNFFVELNWKLYAHLRKTDLQEKGLSVFFGIIYDHELFFVQFGRIFCALSDGKKLRFVGSKYRDYQMQTLKKLNLLGYADEDIKVRVQRLFIGENHRFIAISGNLCGRVFETQCDLATLDHYIESFTQSDNPLWLILDGKTHLIQSRRKKLSRLQISSIVIIVLTLFATAYMLFGNRFLDQALHRTRMNVQNNPVLRLEQIPDNLSVETKNFLKYLDRIVNLPARNIELDILWSATLPYQVTSPPVFSLNTIYLAADHNLIAFDKKSRELIWKKSFATKINSIFYADNVLLVCLEDNQSFGFKDNGTQLWEAELTSIHTNLGSLEPRQVVQADDPRLDRAITVVPSAKLISIFDAFRGENLSTITFKQELHSLSAYDNYGTCFYAIVDDGLICIQLKIAN
ncbi:MAG: PQQ-binding-like beta-propeller repeat protein [Candidatus Cloacimonetes bacterium]|nr:PQQ-binding-like beta-propeller repeat protein [Candidatus Cloacimonadota bacterium]MDY0171899.1 PQQ-binding-like beta-propeller repeat protein [Candidatus Cloacimonadaceae bacterium]